ncbi:hypothetical protein [Mycobacteroides abscessus]|uniref:hypothetical protein n=1 Tax=Mycobacteroides abscessus TaxID=36809 RepID=UPI000928865C|nr:hypothetical protein [Mycobacteroides abscessus]MBN7371115.1 hypothetical protein [Mycobacteroides abscessus subsp. abscessus]MBN7521281.1 hypothetical protein [Mycobacteroides abscessus subsp. abscessus]MDB2185149.1 hypothetical protein [Mycobacteroides abscessus subsp. abscessus]MDO3123498.1 hypothetical protein [Mycobacteroides abscessus subsp. abscessus]MDO3173309.1 hypothetical protein [Mycobacteroides abscessus subsp. abscessus]
MARPRAATPTNRTAGNVLIRETLRKIRSRANAVDLALKQANQAEPEVVLAKLAEVRQAYLDLDQLCLELAGAAMLGGYTAEEVKGATGIGTATLTRRVPRSLAALRGKHLVRDHDAPHGWREDSS